MSDVVARPDRDGHTAAASEIRRTKASRLLFVEAVAQTIQIPTALVTVGEPRQQLAVLDPGSQFLAEMGVTSMCYPVSQMMHRVSDRFVQRPRRGGALLRRVSRRPRSPGVAQLSARQHDAELKRDRHCSQASVAGACSASQTTRVSKRPSTRDSTSALGEGIASDRDLAPQREVRRTRPADERFP
jgi:hypothetical protein